MTFCVVSFDDHANKVISRGFHTFAGALASALPNEYIVKGCQRVDAPLGVTRTSFGALVWRVVGFGGRYVLVS